MMTFSFVSVFIIGVCINAVSTVEDLAENYRNQEEKTVGRSFTLTTCDYNTQGFHYHSCPSNKAEFIMVEHGRVFPHNLPRNMRPLNPFVVGYTCLSCHRALHCFFGNVAILVDCYGARRYCRDGRCSIYAEDKCTQKTNTTLVDTTVVMPEDTTIVQETEAGTMRTTVAEGVPTTVAEVVPTTVAEAVSTNVAEVVLTTVSEALPTTVTETVATTVISVNPAAENNVTTNLTVQSNNTIDNISSNVV